MENSTRIMGYIVILTFACQLLFEMNVTLIAKLIGALFLSEFMITGVVAIFFTSLLSRPTLKSNFPITDKFKEDPNDEGKPFYRNREDKQKPHIIIILADDMGWNDVSFHGSDQIPTPNIDALACNGIILNNHYVPALCTPSRSALMTGKNPIHLGMQHSVIFPAEPRGLPLSEKLLPQYLKEAGYKTHAIGKWHLGFYRKEYTPTYRGFDSHFGYWNGLQDYYTHITQEPDPEFSNFIGFDMRRNLTVAWETAGIYSTDLFTNEAVRLIQEHDTNQPMFLYLAHLAPHKGNENELLRAPDEEIAKFSYIQDPERRIQAAVVSKLDESVGEVVDALRNRGMLENSIVLFMSDNGAPTEGILSNQGSNYPLRGIKDSPWEGGTRGVAAIWSPLFKNTKKVSNQMMFVSDWLPTLLSAAGVSKTQLRDMDGFNLWPTLVSDRVSPRSEIVLNIDDLSNYAAIRRGDFKYVIGQTETGSAWLGASGGKSEGISPQYDPQKVLHSKAGVAISGVITARQVTELKERRKRSLRNPDDPVFRSNFRDEILTADKVIELRKQAQIKCNVREDEKVACDPMKAPCLFNIERDPCEMVNIAKKRPIILAILERILQKYRLTAIPPSNTNGDPTADPSLWNNTWTSWDENNPLSLSYMNDDEFQPSSGTTVAAIFIIFGFFVIGIVTLLAVKCRKSMSSDEDFAEYQSSREGVANATNKNETFPMSNIVHVSQQSEAHEEQKN